MPKKFLTLSEAVSRLQESDDSELEDPVISIIPPESYNLLDLEDVNDEDVGATNISVVRDVVGECEISTKEDLDQFIKARKPTTTWEKKDKPNIVSCLR